MYSSMPPQCHPSQEFSPTKTLDGIETLDDDEDSDWLGEYQRGCDWEIYTTELSRYGNVLCYTSILILWCVTRAVVVLFVCCALMLTVKCNDYNE